MSGEVPSSEQQPSDPDATERSDVDAALDELSDVLKRLEQSPDDQDLQRERDTALLQVGKAAEPLVHEAQVSRTLDAVFHEAEQKGEGLHEETHAPTTIEDAPLDAGRNAHVTQALGHLNAAWQAGEKKDEELQPRLIETNALIESSINSLMIAIDDALKDSPREVDYTRRLSRIFSGLRRAEAECLEIPVDRVSAFYHKSKSAQQRSVQELSELNAMLRDTAEKVAKIYNELKAFQE